MKDKSNIVILQKEHPTGGYHLEINEEDKTARCGNIGEFMPIEDLYNIYFPLAGEGEPWAWNICYMLESYRDTKFKE